MTDNELLALAALCNAYVAETLAANQAREHVGNAPAYDGFAGPQVMQELEEELNRRRRARIDVSADAGKET